MSDPWSRGEHYRESGEMPSAVPPRHALLASRVTDTSYWAQWRCPECGMILDKELPLPTPESFTLPWCGRGHDPIVMEPVRPVIAEVPVPLDTPSLRTPLRTRLLVAFARAWWARQVDEPPDEFTRAEQQTRYGLVLAYAVLLAALLVLVFSFLLPALLPSQPPVVTP